MSLPKKLLTGSAVLVAILLLVLGIRTLSFPDRQVGRVPEASRGIPDPDGSVRRLSGALSFRTISHQDLAKTDYATYLALHRYLQNEFPRTHQTLAVEKVGQYSLLYTWTGSDPALKPLLLTAHMDVVGVEQETLSQWRHAPFSGDVAEGKVWGRGARDNKGQLMSILEATELMLEMGIQPRRTLMIAFGHDEEVLGQNGARKVADLLKERGVHPECVIDEGGTIKEKAVPGLSGKSALIATAEKGYLTLRLSVMGKAGHSSAPERDSSIGILSRALTRIESNPFPNTLREVEPMLSWGVPNMKFPFNVVFGNTWLTSGIVKSIMSGNLESAAMMHTTVVPTILSAGYQDNVVPAAAQATLNLRLMPGDTTESVSERITQLVDDPRIKVERVGYYNDAPTPAPTDTESFERLCLSIRQVFPDAICLPFFSTGGTDTKHYAQLTPNLYRFTPSIKAKDEANHGINEHIPISNYMEYIAFYVNLIDNFCFR